MSNKRVIKSLRRGDRGAAVILLQGVLHRLGYDITNIDGIYGGETHAAIESFQSDYEIGADGVFGKNTANNLIAALWDLGEDEGEWETSDDMEWDEDDDGEYDYDDV